MTSIPKITGVMLCGVTLYLSMPQAALAINNYAEEPSESTHTIQGEVLDVGGNLFLVREQDGGLIVLHTDKNTQGTETVSRGDQIEAKVSDVDDLTIVLSIREMN
jgi:hypothetical protein